MAMAQTATDCLRLPLAELAGSAGVAAAPAAAEFCLRVADAQGSYTIPYIQTGRRLRLRGEFGGAVTAADLTLMLGATECGRRSITVRDPEAVFADLAAGEYALRVDLPATADGRPVQRRVQRVGIGTVVACLGDSITEGYLGHEFRVGDLELTAATFPAASVSRDGRNYPQFAPTAHRHRPAVNCFQSWLTDLNDRLTDAWQHPVFLANEGWGGITVGGYLQLARQDENWRARMRLLAPQLWLLHLGVNDERAQLPAAEVAANLEALVDLLERDFGAAPDRVWLAKPCYDYFPNARPYLEAYGREIEALTARRGLRAGPDFYAAYATDKRRWYGVDPVHPNVAGMQRMAALWAEAILTAAPTP